MKTFFLPVASTVLFLNVSAHAQICGFIQNLGIFPGGSYSFGAAVSSNGELVTGDSNIAGEPRIYHWTASGGMQTLTDRGYLSVSGMSADGSVVVGTSLPFIGPHRAFRWTANEDVVFLEPPPGLIDAFASNVSADGTTVVGFLNGLVYATRAFFWRADTGMRVFGDPDHGIAAYDVSADGSVIVGALAVGLSRHAFVWTQSDGVRDLGVLPGAIESSAQAVSADGTVVVGFGDFGDTTRAFRWTAAGGMQDLGTLPGKSSSFAYDVSADGSVVVGESGSASEVRAFRWTASTGMRDLGALPGDTRSSARGVSADGSVVVGQSAGSATWHAFRWSECSACPADFDRDGYLTFEDFDAFVGAFEMGDWVADFDGDGFLTFEDIDALVAAFDRGC